MKPFRVRSLRGGIEETIHPVHVAVVELSDAATPVRTAGAGDRNYLTLMRSAAKPFQAIPLVQAAADRFAVTQPELALCCASHNSEADQVGIVESLLTRLGLDENALVCGPHRPLIRDVAHYVPDAPPDPPLARRSRLASNCSGKHTGMLAVALADGVPTDGYEQRGHSVQAACLSSIARLTGLATAHIGHAIDGCGVASWAIPLVSIATAYARLGRGGEAEQRVVRAMLAYPELVAGHRRLCTALMQAYPDRIVAKLGAAGVYGAAVPERGIGIAVKVADGNVFAAGVALLSALHGLELLPDLPGTLPAYWSPAILNTRRDVVGVYEAMDGLRWDDRGAR